MVADETFLLDLLNSTPVVDGAARDELDADWLRAHGGTGTPAELRATAEAREVLQALSRAEAPLTALAPLLDGVRRRPVVTDDDVTWELDVPDARRPAVRAVLAWDEVRRSSPGRLRPCANTECARFLVDHSKPNRARWCSMALCGNRMKARRHYERTRTTDAPR
ncbi:CGNR zinc finger domain-containing protein [Promicromonospora thailandica]|uniref:CGNR zinc finger domain-containing protein n=1 Tax=Promicromonospora thailandica TaxID=765201 RepID=A0A9X2G849_9MICO|nr:CGNR zinc finger domain-containing protein [Promicromonospora thailandica]MCP2264356.1 CGNR zinc finger domain-containing protein [Promicromonospora thailandica]BFF20953.1 CGNR zinc finger domain-containing protein [Promicromonospora thailandica]